ncbi:MAG: hypothetical protein JSS43_08425 [Proteobacteria bacterium]|nr:hypothetical protein [Pseudomonadota bacterium]
MKCPAHQPSSPDHDANSRERPLPDGAGNNLGAGLDLLAGGSNGLFGAVGELRQRRWLTRQLVDLGAHAVELSLAAFGSGHFILRRLGGQNAGS